MVAAHHRSARTARRVPIAIHWDHGATYEQILQAIQYGFTSVMIDGSLKPFEENLAITKKVTDSAHAVGVSVEGELGTIGGNDSYAEAGAAEIIYTDPDDAVTFVEQTGVDSLAIAIGTFHGLYPAHLKPELKLDLLKEIKSRVQIPLVLHGGSGNPDDEIREARGSASTRSTSRPTSRSPTTTRCARCWATTPSCASRTRSSRRASRP